MYRLTRSRHFLQFLVLWLLAGPLLSAVIAAEVRPEAVPSPVPMASAAPGPEPRVFFQDQPKGLGEHFTAWKFNYVGEVLGNLAGGIRQGAIYDGYVKVALGVNLEKLVGWQNTACYASLF